MTEPQPAAEPFEVGRERLGQPVHPAVDSLHERTGPETRWAATPQPRTRTAACSDPCSASASSSFGETLETGRSSARAE